MSPPVMRAAFALGTMGGNSFSISLKKASVPMPDRREMPSIARNSSQTMLKGGSGNKDVRIRSPQFRTELAPAFGNGGGHG